MIVELSQPETYETSGEQQCPGQDFSMPKPSLCTSADESVQSCEEVLVVTAVAVTLLVRGTVKDITVASAAGGVEESFVPSAAQTASCCTASSTDGDVRGGPFCATHLYRNS